MTPEEKLDKAMDDFVEEYEFESFYFDENMLVSHLKQFGLFCAVLIIILLVAVYA